MRRPDPPAPRRRRLVLAGLLAAATLGLVVACSEDGREMRPPKPDQNLSIITTTIDPVDSAEDIATIDTAAPTSSSPGPSASEPAGTGFTVQAPWADGGEIDPRHTCDGDDISPALSWSGVPDDAVELAIVMLDDDAVATGDGGFIHWVVAGIDPSITEVAEREIPPGAYEGTNGFSTADAPQVGYGGPCPPPGEPAHTYRLEIHALDQQIELGEAANGADLLAAIDFASIERAVVLGTYGR